VNHFEYLGCKKRQTDGQIRRQTDDLRLLLDVAILMRIIFRSLRLYHQLRFSVVTPQVYLPHGTAPHRTTTQCTATQRTRSGVNEPLSMQM